MSTGATTLGVCTPRAVGPTHQQDIDATRYHTAIRTMEGQEAGEEETSSERGQALWSRRGKPNFGSHPGEEGAHAHEGRRIRELWKESGL